MGKNGCRQEEQESGKRDAERSEGVWGAARISPSSPNMLWGHRDRARSSGSGGWSLEGKNPTAQHVVHRGYPQSSHVGMNKCVNGSHGTQDLLVQVLRPLPS